MVFAEVAVTNLPATRFALPKVGVAVTVNDSVPGRRIVVTPAAPTGVIVNVAVSPATLVEELAESVKAVGAPPFVHVTDVD
jgi:hypothetical protein